MDESLIREQEAQLQKTGRYYKHICFMAAVSYTRLDVYKRQAQWTFFLNTHLSGNEKPPAEEQCCFSKSGPYNLGCTGLTC